MGMVKGAGGCSGRDLFYTAKQWDEDVGLYYFSARWYDPNTARFITEDPIRDGLLWYAYCSNNPMKFIDPTGLREIKEDPVADEKERKAEREKEREREEEEEYDRGIEEGRTLRDGQYPKTFGPDPDAVDDAVNYNNFKEPLKQNDPALSDIPNMASDGCNFRTYQSSAEYETQQNLTAEQIKESVEKLQNTPVTNKPDLMVLDKDMRVNNPDQVIDDAFDRLGQPDTSATVGHGGNGQKPDYYREHGYLSDDGDHNVLLDREGKLLNDPHSPALMMSDTHPTAIFIHR